MAEITKINDQTWSLEDEVARFYLIAGDEKAILLDSGMMTPNARELAESLTDLPIELMNTHGDPDHVSGSAAFEYIFMSENEIENFHRNGGTSKVLPVKEGDVFELGGRTLEIIDVPGHTPGCIAVLDRTNRVLFGGDIVQDGVVFMFKEHRNMKTYVESLKHLLTYTDAFDVIYPAHGTCPMGPEQIDKMIEAAEKVLSGDLKGFPTEVHGDMVKFYRFPQCGFFCD